MHRIFICDDHKIVRIGVKLLLSSMPDLVLVGEAESGTQALELIPQLQVHIVLLDLAIGQPDGVTVARMLKEQKPDLKIIGFTFSTDTETLRAFLQSGAEGFVSKGVGDTEELALALRIVISGGRYLSPSLMGIEVPGFLRNATAQHDKLQITPRERDVLVMIADGLSSKEIAFRLALSIQTVNRHRSSLLEKAGVSNAAQLSRWATMRGLAGAR
ncbi:MAG: response regulator transcription factor [Spirochaetota bacterium]